jgi:hypothetical protein
MKGLEIILELITPAIKASSSWADDMNGAWKMNALKCFRELANFQLALENYQMSGGALGLRSQKILDSYLSLS